MTFAWYSTYSRFHDTVDEWHSKTDVVTCRTPEAVIRWLLLTRRRSINVFEVSVILVGLSMICSRLYVLVRSSSFRLSGREESFLLAILKLTSSTIPASYGIENSATWSSWASVSSRRITKNADCQVSDIVRTLKRFSLRCVILRPWDEKTLRLLNVGRHVDRCRSRVRLDVSG